MPSRSELGSALDCTKVSAHLLLKKLEAKNLVKIRPKEHRAVYVTKAGRDCARLIRERKNSPLDL